MVECGFWRRRRERREEIRGILNGKEDDSPGR